MNEVFQTFLRKFVLVFFDDILVYSSTWIDHLYHLREVFAVLVEHEFYANPKKFVFGQRVIAYFGHVISREGVTVNPEKVQVVR